MNQVDIFGKYLEEQYFRKIYTNIRCEFTLKFTQV